MEQIRLSGTNTFKLVNPPAPFFLRQAFPEGQAHDFAGVHWRSDYEWACG